jgi:acetaldehyde dehydrogenase
MNCLIIGAGKIGIDLYIKCKKINFFDNIFIFNRNKNSPGAKFCKKKNFNYSASGIKGLISKLNLSKINIIFDASSADSSIINYKILSKYLKNNYYINLTPSKIGDYVVPYYDLLKKIPQSINLITCGGQSSIPLILELQKVLRNIIYVELASSIASLSAGEATRENVENYLINTKSAISQLSGIINNKVIINFNPSNPPVNMMNSLFFETKNKLFHRDFLKINQVIKKINKKIKIYIPQYNAKIFKTEKNNIFRITVRVVGQGDYLPAFAGNLDIITSSAAYLSKLIYEKNYN